jgi:hypothetical protein
MDGFLGLLTIALVVWLTIRSRRLAKNKALLGEGSQSDLLPPSTGSNQSPLSAPTGRSQGIERSKGGLFNKSASVALTPEGLAIEETKGWTAIEGEARLTNVESGSEPQRTVKKLFDSVGSDEIPVRLKFDPFSKDSVSVHSRIGIVCELDADETKPWMKRISSAADERKFYVGTVKLHKAYNSDHIRASLYLNRPNEIAIDIEMIPPKTMTEDQITKSLLSLAELVDAYPETNAQVRSQGKKAVKLVAGLYGHALHLDEMSCKYKESLKDLCADFINECELCADSEDEIGSEIEYFVESWNECVTQTGAYAPVVPSAFALADLELLKNNAELATLLIGKSIVLSGDFEDFSREEGHAAIVNRGGKSPGSVSGRTFALVIGRGPGVSKQVKARELNIPIIEVDQFKRILEIGEM